MIDKELPPAAKEDVPGAANVSATELLKNKSVPIFGVLFRGGGAFQDYTEMKTLDMAAEGLKQSLDRYTKKTRQ